MSLSRLVWREIRHRPWNSGLMLLSVLLAVACCVGMITLLDSQSRYNHQQVVAMDNEIRKITKDMGFNILILPQAQNLSEFFAEDFASQTMPESYVDRLASSRDVFTIRHLRPALIRKVTWSEQNRQVILMGVRGVVPFAHRSPKKPLADPVPSGMIDIGHVVASELDLATGDPITLLGDDFKVHHVYPPRGNKDDITIWMELTAAQRLVELPGQINLIQALECNCASVDRLAEIEAEVSSVLGQDVQVIELATKAIARAKARTRVQEEGQARMSRWRSIASVIITASVAAASIMVGLLSLINARQRMDEIGILRALGLRTKQLLGMFLAKSALIGLVGGIFGGLIGLFFGYSFESNEQGESFIQAVKATQSVTPMFLLSLIVLTPMLTVIAGWLPALYAMSRAPAEILREN